MSVPAQNLNHLVEKATFEVLNANAGSFDESMRSTDDEQMIIRGCFQSPVKISKISFRAGNDENGPKSVRLFVNVECPNFDDVNELKPQQSLQLTRDQVKKAEQLPLRYVNFQNVRSITIFVENNQSDGDVTEIDQIVFWGSEEQSMDMKKWDPKKDNQEG